MNFARVAVAACTAWVAYLVIGYFVHEIMLAELYRAHAPVFRPAEVTEDLLPVALVAALVGFFVFAYAYAKGYEGGPGLQEGSRFGVLVGLLLVAFGVAWRYVIFPISPRLFVLWVADYVLEFACYGAIVGLIYRPLTPRRTRY